MAVHKGKCSLLIRRHLQPYEDSGASPCRVQEAQDSEQLLKENQRTMMYPQKRDSEEQEAEIKRLWTRHRAETEKMQNMLDIGVFTVIFFTTFLFLRMLETPSLLAALSFTQLFLLPFSLTPYWLPLFRPYTTAYHPYIALAQISMFALAFPFVWKASSLADIVRWALPELISGAVELQRRGQRETEEKLSALEGLKYDVTGP